MNYLEEMKRMRKKTSNTEFYRKKNSESEIRTKKSHTNYLSSSNQKHKDYSQIKIKRVDKLLS